MAASGLDSPSGREIRLSSDAATRLGVTPGAVVEFVNPLGAPLRAWVTNAVAPLVAGGAPVAELAPIALRMLTVVDGAEVEVRRVHTGVLAPVVP